MSIPREFAKIEMFAITMRISKMKEKIFKIYLVFCVIIFFVLLLIVLFYSFGYKYNPEQNKIIQTGTIVIKNMPKNTDIYIDGSLVKNNIDISNFFNNFIKIESLEPKTYNLKITKKDYLPWEKNIEVKGQKITEIENVILIKDKLSSNIVSRNIIDNNQTNIWPNDKNNKIVYEKTINNKIGLFVFDLSEKKENFLLLEDIFTKNKITYKLNNVIWSKNDKKILIETANKIDIARYIIDLSDGNKIYSLTNKIKEINNNWNFIFGNSLFYLENGIVNEMAYPDFASKSILSDISAFCVNENEIYYIRNNDNNLYFNRLNSINSESIIARMPDNFDSKKETRLIKSNKNTFLALSSSGVLYFVSEKGETISINHFAKEAYFDDSSEKVIYYNDREIWIFYAKEILSQPEKKLYSNELITRYSGNISNVYLYKDSKHLFYKEGNIFKFLELDNRDKINIYNITEIKNKDILYLPGSDIIFFVKDQKLYETKLID